MDLRTDDFDYHLPPHLIAQNPAPEREASRLLVLERATTRIEFDVFAHLPHYLRPGDVVVANRSRVIPARLEARKESGGSVELLLLKLGAEGLWRALARPSRRLRAGMVLAVSRSSLHAVLLEGSGEGEWLVRFEGSDVERQLREAGAVPLPPYIHNMADADRYQTVYADRDGSIAAPTAGLHFSSSVIEELRRREVPVQFVTLHVGLGTFRPVGVERVSDHRMHAEWGEVPEAVAAEINMARAVGGRAVAIGTTTTRLLESAFGDGRVNAFQGETDRFIYPPYTFRAVDALVTNFHLPRSTLLMLVSAFAGRDLVLHAYQEAIRHELRFYSFGDAMLIL